MKAKVAVLVAELPYSDSGAQSASHRGYPFLGAQGPFVSSGRVCGGVGKAYVLLPYFILEMPHTTSAHIPV